MTSFLLLPICVQCTCHEVYSETSGVENEKSVAHAHWAAAKCTLWRRPFLRHPTAQTLFRVVCGISPRRLVECGPGSMSGAQTENSCAAPGHVTACVQRAVWLSGILDHDGGGLISQCDSTIKSLWLYSHKLVNIMIWTYMLSGRLFVCCCFTS